MRLPWIVPALALPLWSQQAPVSATTSTLPRETAARLAALKQAQDWSGIATLIDSLPPAGRGSLLELWLKALSHTGAHERVVAIAEVAIPQMERSGPRLSTARLYRAQALSQLQRHKEAMRAHADNGSLGWADGYPNACAEARLAQDWTALQAHAEAILARTPNQAQALAWKGEALARLGHTAQGEAVLQESLGLDPQLAFGWSNLGFCLNERKAWAEALEACDKALALDPKLLEARYNRGRACFELARYLEARNDFQAALSLLPGDAVLTENLRQAQRYLDTASKAKKNKK